mgnify:CR=1 FL=1
MDKSGNHVLGKRVFFGTVGVCFLIPMLWIGGWFFDLSMIIIALIGARELYAAFSQKGFMPQAPHMM